MDIIYFMVPLRMFIEITIQV